MPCAPWEQTPPYPSLEFPFPILDSLELVEYGKWQRVTSPFSAFVLSVDLFGVSYDTCSIDFGGAVGTTSVFVMSNPTKFSSMIDATTSNAAQDRSFFTRIDTCHANRSRIRIFAFLWGKIHTEAVLWGSIFFPVKVNFFKFSFKRHVEQCLRIQIHSINRLRNHE